MDYQKEYASLVGQVDRAISLLENYAPGDPVVRTAGARLLTALREAEEQYVQAAEEAGRLDQGSGAQRHCLDESGGAQRHCLDQAMAG